MKKKIIKYAVILGVTVLCCYFFGYSLNCFIKGGYHLKYSARWLFDGQTFMFTGVILLVAVFIAASYYYTHYWLFNSKNIIKGKERDKHIAANLEQARFESEKEITKNFQTVYYDKLAETEVKGIPIIAYEEKKRLRITFSPPTHALVIGTTGSGKTTTFVNPTVQILATSKTKPSMIISDPKGELYQMHAKKLKDEGYTVKILDLRNPYNSVRWNPMESAYLNYIRILNLEKEVIIHEDRGTYEFDGKEYYNPKDKDAAIQVKKQQLNDIVYEDLHDITTVLCPVTDYKTIEEFSKRCGNYSIVQRSVGFNTVRADDVNSNTSVKERPLIYPSELQQLNSKGNMGNAIVTVFGYQPIKAKFTPSYQSHFYDLQMSEQELLTGRYFDEAAAFYDMKARNVIVNISRRRNTGGGGDTVREQIAERRRQASMTEKLQIVVSRSLQGFATEQETADIFVQVKSAEYDKAIKLLKQIQERAKGDAERLGTIQNTIARLEEIKNGELRLERK